MKLASVTEAKSQVLTLVVGAMPWMVTEVIHASRLPKLVAANK